MVRDARKTVTRERILAAALELFAERGYDAVSVQSIGERAEIAHGTVFWHFGSKQILYIEVARWAGERFQRALEPVVLRCRGPGSFLKLLNAQHSFMVENPAIGRLSVITVFEVIGPHPELAEVLDHFNRRISSIWYKWAELAATDNILRPGISAHIIARIAMDTLSGLLIANQVREANMSERLAAIADAFENGCLIAPAPETRTEVQKSPIGVG